MRRKPKLGPTILASVIVLCTAQVALAQVEWGERQLCVEPGDPGTWNSGGHQVGDVVFDGSLYHLYLVGGEGWISLDFPWSVGHWTSDDVAGPWTPDLTNPVLPPGASRAWDSFGIVNIAVLYDGAMFRMWYSAAESYHAPLNAGYATSLDGSSWTKHEGNPLPGLEPGAPGAWDDYGVTPGTVVFDGESYRMWYSAASLDPWGDWRIGHAVSPDGLSWHKDPEPILEGREPWEGANVYFPEVVPNGAGFQMWYSGHDAVIAALGHAVSPDGLRWGRWDRNPVLDPTDPCTLAHSMAVILEGDTAHGWVAECGDIYCVSSQLEVVFYDAFETGDTSIWSGDSP